MALITDKFTEITNGQNPDATTVTSPRVGGGTTLSTANLGGWPTNTAVHFTTYKIDGAGAKIAGTQTDWKGLVSGTNINSLTRVGGAADSGSAVGDVVQMMPTASWGQDLAIGLQVSHDPSGVIKNGAISAAAMLASSVVTEPKLADNSVDSRAYVDNSIDAEHLSTTTINLAAVKVTSTQAFTSGTATQATGLTSTVTIPSGGRKVRIKAELAGSFGTAARGITLEIWDGTVGSGTKLQGRQRYFPSAGTTDSLTVETTITPAAGSKTYNVGLSIQGGASTFTTSSSSTEPAELTIDVM